MAAVSELITLGIGTPSTVPHFLTFGLFDPNAVIIQPTPDCVVHVRPDVGVIDVRPDVWSVES